MGDDEIFRNEHKAISISDGMVIIEDRHVTIEFTMEEFAQASKAFQYSWENPEDEEEVDWPLAKDNANKGYLDNE